MSTPPPADAPSGAEPSAAARPAPHYGEYATPEQQRAAIREPVESPASEPGRLSASPAPGAQPVQQMPHGVMPTRTASNPTTSAAQPSRTADRIVTVALLAYGLITVISAVPQLWHFAGFAQAWMDLVGIDATFTNTAQGDVWGRVGAGVFVAGWLLTALSSWRSLARGRLSWWIPLVGAIVSFVIVSVCLTVPLLGDPAITGHFGG